MRKDEYIKECMVWKSGKKGIFERVTFYEKPCTFFFNFQNLRKKYETKVVGNVSSYCSKFFLFWWNLKNEGIRAFLHAFFYMYILYNIPWRDRPLTIKLDNNPAERLQLLLRHEPVLVLGPRLNLTASHICNYIYVFFFYLPTLINVLILSLGEGRRKRVLWLRLDII